MASQQHYQSPQSAEDGARSRQHGPPIQTQNLRQNPRFSWQQTPVQPQNSRFSREVFSSPTTTIDESPLSASTARAMDYPSIHQPVQHTNVGAVPLSPYPEDKPPSTIPPPNAHPAHFAPYAEPDAQQFQGGQQQQQYPEPRIDDQKPAQYPHHPQQSFHQRSLSPTGALPLQTNLPIPPIPPSSEPKRSTTPRTPTYTPHSPFGPNSTAHHPSTSNQTSTHLPGQIAHPNSQLSKSWSSSLFSVDTTCLHGIFSPCTLYSLTSYRLGQKSKHKDPTNMLSHTTCDGRAWLFGVTCGLCGVLTCVQRGRVRRGYGIEGGVGGDCASAVCCGGCALAQGEKEVKEREESWKRNQGPALGYRMEGGMHYDPPPKSRK